MRPLNLREARKLHDLIRPYLPPSGEEGLTVLALAGTILRNMQARDPLLIADLVSLLTGMPARELAGESGRNLLKVLLEGLSENRVLALKEFVEGLDYDG